MEIILPEDISKITLGHFQELYALKQRKLKRSKAEKQTGCIFTDLKIGQLAGICLQDRKEILEHIDDIIDMSKPLKRTFRIQNIEFGFLFPNLEKMSTYELEMFAKYETGVENLHRLMAIVFRPISQKYRFGNYKVEPFTGTDALCDVMKKTPLDIVGSTLGYLWHLKNHLKSLRN